MMDKEKRAAQFLARAKEKFGDLYDYSNIQYEHNRAQVTIICPHHGEFRVLPNNFLARDIGCPHCGREAAKRKGERTTTKKEPSMAAGHISSMSVVIKPSILTY
ncbi:DUF723 domain-containing protein [Vibrio maritimus]|uniref:DUF723 domain-containing protein n=1 Tax=Vibrio maritimus TaxID=990268 RepID=UPI003AF22761